MTEHEDLITEAREEIETWDMANGTLIPRLVNALEKVTVERDALSSLRGQMSLRLRYVEGKREQAEAERDRLDEAFDRDLPWRYDEVETQRNQLAAVVEQVRVEITRIPPNGFGYYAPDGNKLLAILNSAPTAALDRVKAEARAEGVREARSYIQRIAPAGLVDRAAVLADLKIAAERLSQGTHANGRDRIEKGESNE